MICVCLNTSYNFELGNLKNTGLEIDRFFVLTGCHSRFTTHDYRPEKPEIKNIRAAKRHASHSLTSHL